MENNNIEILFPSYFEGQINDSDKLAVDKWKSLSTKNQQTFADSYKVWTEIEHLNLMKKYNSNKALEKLHSNIYSNKKPTFHIFFQKTAVILLLPLMLTTLYFAFATFYKQKTPVPWHTLNVPAGIRSNFTLPDGTKIYLNSKTKLSYPITFDKKLREIKLTGEAYFDVKKDKKSPFIVNTGGLNIEVTGTEFLVSNYPNEKLTEIVLIEGSINLFTGDYNKSKNDITMLTPGNKVTLNANNKLYTTKIDTEKYRAWKDGILIFRDDPMPEVVRRLNRWFNVNIYLKDNKLDNWTYTATFEDESLNQILELLKISAPIDYTIKPRKLNTNNTFNKMEIEIMTK